MSFSGDNRAVGSSNLSKENLATAGMKLAGNMDHMMENQALGYKLVYLGLLCASIDTAARLSIPSVHYR
jgi:hypothetical protein